MPNKAHDDDQVMSLVELALARAPEERERFLHSVCAHDSQLFEEVRKYVEWEERMNGFLLEPLYPSGAYKLTLEPGELLDGRFRIVREVAQGGMGIVYEALDERLERRIAIKCAKPGFRKRLPPEVRHATEVSHPNVCKIFEIHTASTDRGEIDFITMEFLEGETLAERLRRGPLPEAQARAIAQQLCAGLAAAHRNQVIHGDLKSNNVILTTAADGSIRAVITDFGLARRPETTQQTVRSGEAGGTPDYMAPELWKGEKATAASDIYALGVILYELASGHAPFPSSTGVSWEERLSAPPPAVNPKWDRVLSRCLEADPARRFQSAQEVGQALAPRSRRWLLAAAAAVVLAAASGVVTYERATAPKETVRLALLKFDSDAETKPLSEGLLLEAADHLNHLKGGRTRRLTIIPLGDALQHKVDRPAKARTMLGATVALEGALRKEAGRIRVVAYLTDTSSLVHMNEWRADYSIGELRNMPVALAGMVTGALKLPPLAVAASVNAAAYSDYLTGVSLLSRGDQGIDQALASFGRAVAADPNSPLTHTKLAEAQWRKFLQTGDPQWQELALTSLRDAEQRNPDVAAVRLLSGLIHGYFGQYEQAEADLLRAIELDANNGDAWRELATVYDNNNEPNRSLTAYLKAIEVQPDYYKNYFRLGTFYFNRGEYEESARQRKRTVELAPDLAEAHYALAAPYLNMGRYADAEHELILAIGFQKTADAVLGLGLSRLYQGQYREAIPYFEQAIEIGPATSLYYMNLGTAWRRANFLREADDAYRKGLDLAETSLAQNPKDGYERSILGYLCAQLNDRGRAESETLQALHISNQAINVRWSAAQTFEVLGRRGRTLALLQDAPRSIFYRIQRNPDFADLRADPSFQRLLLFRHIQ